jgi:drug/metabolite transporter, DME family
LWNNPRVHRTLVLLAAVAFGTTGTAQALGPDGADPLTVGAARIVVGGALLAAVAWLVAPRSEGRWPAGLILASGAAIAVYQLSFFESVDRTGVAIGTVVALGSAPAMTGLLSKLMHRTQLTGRWAGCTALATAGVLLLVLSGESAKVEPVGVLLALAAGAGYAFYTVAAKGMLDAGHPPEAVMGRAFGTGALLLVPVVLIGDAAWAFKPGGAAMVLYLALVPTALAYVAFARGLRGLSAGDTATLTLAEPLTAAALGALVLGERPGALAVVGAALVLAGLVALALPGRKAADPVPVPA